MKTFKVISIIVISLICIKTFFGFTSQEDQQTNPYEAHSRSTSVLMIGENIYKIDSNMISKDKNKAALLASLEDDTLILKNTKEEFPQFITTFLNAISTNKKFDLADPGKEWQMCRDQSVKEESRDLPTRQMVCFGLGKRIAVFSYYSGGLSYTGGHRKYQHTVIIKFNDKKIVDLWFDVNSSFFSTLPEIIDDVKNNRNNNKC